MQEVKIVSDIDNLSENSCLKLKQFFELIIKLIIDLKYVLCIFLLLFLLSISYFGLFYDEYIIDLTPFIKYIYDCKNMKKYNRETIINAHPYICLYSGKKHARLY